ncbi:MAG: hypothetical protein JNL24_01335 [Bacteroidia bacterium]|nr:hypothetical protein [Bacteroidia bacterium]
MSQKLIGEPDSKLQTFIRTKGIYVVMATTAVGLFVGIPLLFWLYSKMVISIGLLLLLIFCGGTLGLLQWGYFKRLLDMQYHQFAMFSFSGFGMCLVNSILLLNYFTSIDSYSNTYQVAEMSIYNDAFHFTLVGDDVDFALEFVVNDFVTNHYEQLPRIHQIEVQFETGILGINKVVDCQLYQLPQDL